MTLLHAPQQLGKDTLPNLVTNPETPGSQIVDSSFRRCYRQFQVELRLR
jgi:hypothetical protein